MSVETPVVARAGEGLGPLPDIVVARGPGGSWLENALPPSGAMPMTLAPSSPPAPMGLAAVVAVDEPAEALAIASGVRTGSRRASGPCPVEPMGGRGAGSSGDAESRPVHRRLLRPGRGLPSSVHAIQRPHDPGLLYAVVLVRP